MTKRIEVDGKFYRKRRGVLVEIPAEWVGSTLHPQTMRKRRSKQTRQQRSEPSQWLVKSGYPKREFREKRHEPI